MQKNNFFFIDCSRAENFCDKQQYREAGLREKSSMLFHKLFCRACREYTSKNTKLTRLLNKAKIKACSRDEKISLKEKLRKAMAREKS